MSRYSSRKGIPLFSLWALLLGWPFLPSAKAQPQPVVLSITEVKNLMGEWNGSDRDLDREAIRRLAQTPRNAEVKVFFGVGCKDSQREVPRFLKILSELGEAPFSVKFFQVDKDKKEPAGLLGEHDIQFLPTFIVSRQGREVGRIVERSPRDLEADLTLLLDGKTKGLVSASEPVIWHYLSAAIQPE